MHRNLAFLSRRMPDYVATGTGEQVFGVLSVCRVLYTLRTGAVIGKLAAARWAIGHVEPRWRPLVQRAGKRYENNDFKGRDVLIEDQAEAFADYAAETCPRRNSEPSNKEESSGESDGDGQDN